MEPIFDRAFEPRYGEAVRVAPNVRRVTARNPGPFTFTGTNSFIVGEGNVAIIDPGPDDPVHVEALLAATRGEVVTHILLTHTHRDHSPGARLLQARIKAPIVAEGPHRAARPLLAGEDIRLDASADRELQPDMLIADGESLQGEGWRLTAVATPGHTANHLAFALEDGILFSGDHVMGWATTIVAPPDGAMADYMASLDRLLARRDRLYLPAHGGAIGNPQAHARALKAHRKMRERAILDQLDQGARTIPELVAAIYRDVEPSLHGAAALVLLAHLEDLVARGLAATDGAPALGGTYCAGRGRGMSRR